MKYIFPFSAVVGQDELKLALLLVAIDPGIGGVLIKGERGTAKSTIARALADLLPATSDGRAGVLYVDEVNLLADHLVDLLLDAAASGSVTVERDGLSASEAARFVLIGTMNPEEGELRPQFMDRFGLSVEVRGLIDPQLRKAAIATMLRRRQRSSCRGLLRNICVSPSSMPVPACLRWSSQTSTSHSSPKLPTNIG
jgi:Mg-chelatase subunit ChlI